MPCFFVSLDISTVGLPTDCNAACVLICESICDNKEFPLLFKVLVYPCLFALSEEMLLCSCHWRVLAFSRALCKWNSVLYTSFMDGGGRSSLTHSEEWFWDRSPNPTYHTQTTCTHRLHTHTTHTHTRTYYTHIHAHTHTYTDTRLHTHITYKYTHRLHTHNTTYTHHTHTHTYMLFINNVIIICHTVFSLPFLYQQLGRFSVLSGFSGYVKACVGDILSFLMSKLQRAESCGSLEILQSPVKGTASGPLVEQASVSTMWTASLLPHVSPRHHGYPSCLTSATTTSSSSWSRHL